MITYISLEILRLFVEFDLCRKNLKYNLLKNENSYVRYFVTADLQFNVPPNGISVKNYCTEQ